MCETFTQSGKWAIQISPGQRRHVAILKVLIYFEIITILTLDFHYAVLESSDYNNLTFNYNLKKQNVCVVCSFKVGIDIIKIKTVWLKC